VIRASILNRRPQVTTRYAVVAPLTRMIVSRCRTGSRGRSHDELACSIRVQQPDNPLPTVINLYHPCQERKTFSDPAATGYGSEDRV
jgi:hypothetical protein